MDPEDFLYYHHRAGVELERARNAQSPGAAAAHHEMARLYRFQVDRFQTPTVRKNV